MHKIAAVLALALSSSAWAAPTYLICAGNFFNQGERTSMDDLTMAIDYEAKKVTYLGNEYDISTVNEQTVSAGPVFKNEKMSARMIGLNRTTGGVTVMNSDMKVQFIGTCKVSARKF